MLPVHIINPNSLVAVTASIEAAVTGTGAVDRECRFATLHAGPPGITTQAHADLAATLVAQYVTEHATQAAAFVIACFSDPGVFAAREITRVPVIGIGHAGLVHALSLGRRVGVIAITSSSVSRHWRYWRALQLDAHVVQERALDLPVAQSGDPAIALEKMIQIGRQLVAEDGADVLVLGCAGMAALRQPLQDAVGVPVVDPCQAAAFTVAAQLATAPSASHPPLNDKEPKKPMTIHRTQIGSRMSQAVTYNGTVYLAGQVADDTSLDAAGQTLQALANIDSLLKANGSDRTRLLSTQIFLRSMAEFDAMNKVWDAWIGEVSGHAPTRATVQAEMAAPEYLVEIVVVAAQA